ncbi:hypothetical protein phiOC_p175 [Ochrobactrum phage vB_OspM_OC]|nr:hypothetical protein phiOC_p175 [Ochrobactrum phage vB_OspM_OC]
MNELKNETLEEKIARLEKEIARLNGEVVYGFYEENHPLYAQGPNDCELAEPVTAGEINGLVERISEYKSVLSDPNAVHLAMLRGDIEKPSAKLIKHLYANEQIVDIDGEEFDLGSYEILDRTYTSMDHFSTHVLGHPRIDEFPELKEKAQAAFDALFELYQSVDW